jgi:predicted dehydrogenase
MLRFGNLPVSIHWLDLPGFTKYQMEFACYGPDKRVTLRFPSPFLRSAPTLLEVEGGDSGTARSWRTEEITSYDSAFKAELVAFHDCVITGRPPITDADDALHDTAVCQSIIRCFQTGAPIDHPSRVT